MGAATDSTDRAKRGLRAPNPAQRSVLREVHAAEEGLEAGANLLLHVGDLAVDALQPEAEGAATGLGEGQVRDSIEQSVADSACWMLFSRETVSQSLQTWTGH